jgi:hypothetical protein
VTDFLLFMGKLVVVGVVALLSYFVFSGKLEKRMFSNVVFSIINARKIKGHPAILHTSSPA